MILALYFSVRQIYKKKAGLESQLGTVLALHFTGAYISASFRKEAPRYWLQGAELCILPPPPVLAFVVFGEEPVPHAGARRVGAAVNRWRW